jgi:3-deoxy-manno-octulosonate cytidylyltransferase (CMP-KDO synthetase)
MKRVVGVIPARWQSSRFPGKPLINILGKSLIRRTFENATRCQSLDAIVIATDDRRIFDHAKELGAEVFMTSPACPTGSDRVWEVADRHFPEAEVIVNIQGDEPCLDPQVIDQLVARLQRDEGVCLTTPVAKIVDADMIQNSNVVKCVFDKEGRALYFSRSAIPFMQKKVDPFAYYRHLGVYCFRRRALREYICWDKTRLQKCEDLEQLKMLENGWPIHVCIVDEQALGVDTPEDVKMVESILCQRESICLSPEGLSPLWAKG